MMISEQFDKLAGALAKAQGAMAAAEKDSSNPHFKSKFASLASVREAIRVPLSENGIAYVQTVRTSENAVEVETRLLHESGQFLGDTLVVPLAQATPQGVGSATSYGRRYALMAIVGLAAEDDDADNAQRVTPGQKVMRSASAPPPPPPPPPAAAVAYVALAKTALLNAEYKEDVDSWWRAETESREKNGVRSGTAAFDEVKALAGETKRDLPYRDMRAAG